MDQPLDVFGQQPGLNKLYTQLCFCFPLPSNRRDEAIEALRTGLQCLTAHVPLLSGEVTHDENAGGLVTRAAKNELQLVVRDLSKPLPSFSEYRGAGFPARLLDEKDLAPCETIRRHLDEPAPVFLAQANFIEDGILLVLCGLHGCMDMSGQGYLTGLLAKACRGESISGEDIRAANLRGDNEIPFLSEETLARLDQPQPRERPDRQTAPTPTAIWSYIIFSGQSLANLKSKTAKTATANFVSTDDCLSAFLWQSITRARFARLDSPDVQTSITRTVDARRAAGMAARYTGNAAVKTACGMTAAQLLDSPIGEVASQLRESLVDIGTKFRIEATLLKQGKATTKPSVDPSTGVNLSSWAKEDSYELDFGAVIAKPEAIRRPTFDAWESLVYLMPKKADGETAVAVCLREEDTVELKADAEFAKFGRFVD